MFNAPDDDDLDRYIAGAEPAAPAEEPPPRAAGGNGGPALEEDYAFLERIGLAIYGEFWTGKLAVDVRAHPRQFRRWAEGAGKPTATVLLKARVRALKTAESLLRAVGEDDLAYQVGVIAKRVAAPLTNSGRELMIAQFEAAAVKKAVAKAVKEAAEAAAAKKD
jgi:hypothetical protein